MAVSNQVTPIGGSLDPWNHTSHAVESLAGAAGGFSAAVTEQVANMVVDNREVQALWLQATEQSWFLVAGHFRARSKPSGAETKHQQRVEQIVTSNTVDSLAGQFQFATAGTAQAEVNWKISRLEAVRKQIATAPNLKQRQERQLSTHQRAAEQTHQAQEGKAIIEEAEKIENIPTGRRVDASPYYVAMGRIKIAEAKRKEAQKKEPVLAKGRSAQGPGNVASRQHADKSAGFAGSAGE